MSIHFTVPWWLIRDTLLVGAGFAAGAIVGFAIVLRAWDNSIARAFGWR